MPAQLVVQAIKTVETVRVPDVLLRLAIASFIGMRERASESDPERDAAFARAMSADAIASFTDAANTQHYELPPEFFALVLGPHRKYSSCIFPLGTETLGEAEAKALRVTVARADLKDGQRILELGCGWGSLSLWMAEKLPNATIVAVSNSHSQRGYIEQQATARGLRNLTVVTADMNTFEPEGEFDRVVSVEMFEHMTNWRALLQRIRRALKPDGRLFLHIFAHRTTPYRFDHTDETDWIAKHFFTGGLMPSETLIRQFTDLFTVANEWRWNGQYYARTARCWLENYDRNEGQIRPILERVYGDDAKLWQRRWRLFFLATEGLFGSHHGDEWGVMHYLLKPKPR